MQIKFGRSGGIVAAPGLTIEAALELSGTTGRVSDAGYVRDLSAQEAQEVSAMIDPVSFFALPADLRPSNQSIADQQQYHVTVRMPDGREHSVTMSEMMSGDLDQRSPGLGKFLDWMKQECKRIMKYRVQQR